MYNLDFYLVITLKMFFDGVLEKSGAAVLIHANAISQFKHSYEIPINRPHFCKPLHRPNNSAVAGTLK